MARRLAPVTSFTVMARRAGQLFGDNIVSMACLALVHLAVMIFLLALMGLVMKIFGSALAGLIFGLIVMLLLTGPVLRMLSCYMAINIWDDFTASPLDAVSFIRSVYPRCLLSYLWAVYYEADLWVRTLPHIWPGLFLAAVLHALLHFFTEVDSIFFWDALVVVGVTAPLAISRLWNRVRRIHFLYDFVAFEVVDGKTVFAEDLSEDQSGYWRGRYARIFYRLDDDWWQVPLSRAAWLWLAKNAIWALPSLLIILSGISPLAKFYLVAAFGFTLRYVLNLWYDLAAAGWFRENLASGKYY